MPRTKKTESVPTVKLADFAQPGERVDAMKPGDTRIRSREVTKIPTNKAGVAEPIVRTDIK